jgi:hypothetical protein
VFITILDAFAKLGKATVSFAMSVYLSNRILTWKNLGFQWTGIREINILEFFENLSKKFKYY